MTTRTGRWLFVAVVLVLTVLFVRLGLWQVERLGERRAEVEERRARLELPPVRMDAAEVERRLGRRAPSSDSDTLDGGAPDEGAPTGVATPFPPADSAGWRRIVAEGRFDYPREAVLSPRSRQGSPAVYVVTPLLVADSSAIPVIRGSVPASDGLHAPLARARPVWARSDSAARGAVTGRPLTSDGQPRRFATRPAAPLVTVHGVGYPPPGGEPVAVPDTLHAAGGVHPALPRMDLARLDSIWPWRTAGFYLRADSTTERIPTDAGVALLRPVPPPSLGEGPHRMYALQWFAFAAIALIGGGIFLWRNRDETPPGS